MLTTGKDRASKVPEALAASAAALSGKARMLWVWGLFGMLGLGVFTSIVAFFFDGDDVGGVVCSCMPFGGIFGGITLYSQASRLKTARRKLAFANEMHEAFVDDYHPSLKIHHHLDLRMYDTADKKYWEGRSMHGNAKYRYSDRWYRQKFFLADGTRVTVERRADVKVRKGSIMRHKRRVYLRIEPSISHFGPGPFEGREDLEKMVRQVVKSSFHDPPEFIKVRRGGDLDAIRLKVTQLDAPILGKEVLALVEGVLLYLEMQRE